MEPMEPMKSLAEERTKNGPMEEVVGKSYPSISVGVAGRSGL